MKQVIKIRKSNRTGRYCRDKETNEHIDNEHDYKKDLKSIHNHASESATNTHINSWRPSDTIWRHRSGSTLAEVMACCLTTPSHNLNQCLFIINGVLWYSPYNNFTGSAWDINSWYEFVNHDFEITATYPRGQWVKPRYHIVPMWAICYPASWALSYHNFLIIFGIKPLPEPRNKCMWIILRNNASHSFMIIF